MSTFDIPRSGPDALTGALDQLPDFFLNLARVQEAKKERTFRAERANKQDQARQEAVEIEFLRMFQQSSPEVQVAGIDGMQEFLITKTGRKAGAVVANSATERLSVQKKDDIKEQERQKTEDLFNLATLYAKGVSEGVSDAERGFDDVMGELATSLGISLPQNQPDPLGLFGGEGDGVFSAGIGDFGGDVGAGTVLRNNLEQSESTFSNEELSPEGFPVVDVLGALGKLAGGAVEKSGLKGAADRKIESNAARDALLDSLRNAIK